MTFVILIFLIINNPYDFDKFSVHCMWTVILEKNQSNNSVNVYLLLFVFCLLKTNFKKSLTCTISCFLPKFMTSQSFKVFVFSLAVLYLTGSKTSRFWYIKTRGISALWTSYQANKKYIYTSVIFTLTLESTNKLIPPPWFKGGAGVGMSFRWVTYANCTAGRPMMSSNMADFLLFFTFFQSNVGFSWQN